MSNVSPVPGAATSTTAGLSSSFPPLSQQHSATSTHHQPHHPSQDENASGIPHSSYDSVASHHGYQSQQQQPQHVPPPSQQHNPHPSSNGHPGPSPWGGHPQQVHYGGSYPSHAMYSNTSYYSNPSNGSANYGNGYAAYSVQSHQGQSQQSLYGNHGPPMNGSAHHSGASTPNSTTPYAHHPHPSMGSMFSTQPYHPHHQPPGSYYTGPPSNGMMSSPSYSSGPQYGTQLPMSGRHRVTTTLWEDEGTLCFQVDARGVCVARRHDNNMINGTKLLNVCGMSRGKRDGILKNEKERIVVKVGAMHLKGVWITFLRGRTLAEQNDILDVLYPLFETNIQSFLYHPDNYPRTAAVIAAAQERNTQRSRGPGGTNSPVNPYPPQQRASSHSAGPIPGTTQQPNPPPLMRANTTPGGPLLNHGGPGNGVVTANYHQSNGYSSTPNHSQQHSPYAPTSHTVSTVRGNRDGAIMDKSEVVASDGAAAATPTTTTSVGSRMHYYGEDTKVPLSDSTQLNSNSAYAYHSATNVPLKHHDQNTLPHNRSEQQGEAEGNVNLPPWTYRGNGYNRE